MSASVPALFIKNPHLKQTSCLHARFNKAFANELKYTMTSKGSESRSKSKMSINRMHIIQ